MASWGKLLCLPRQGCIKLLDFSLSSIGWRRGLGRGGAFLLVSPLLGPLPTRSSRGEDGELDATLGPCPAADPRPATRHTAGHGAVANPHRRRRLATGG